MRVVTDEVNTERFGIKMGNITDIGKDIRGSDIENILSSSRAEGYQHLNVKIATEEKKATNIFLEKGFKLVDTQLMYAVPSGGNGGGISEIVFHGNTIVSYREYKKSDKQQVVDIARTAYVLDQFHSDTALDDPLCDNYYAEWMRNCCEGFADKVVVASHHESDEVIGYSALKYGNDSATVILAAVDERYRGNGIFSFLIENTLRVLKEENIDTLHYGTQLSNLPVLKTMGRFNGFVEYSNHVMHLML